MPRVSVLVPSYNHERFVGRAIGRPPPKPYAYPRKYQRQNDDIDFSREHTNGVLDLQPLQYKNTRRKRQLGQGVQASSTLTRAAYRRT